MRQAVCVPATLSAAVGAAMLGLPIPARAVTDWDLYSLRLVNRARSDPAGEAARVGSSVVDNSAPQPALAYQLQVEQAATNHNNWMFDNLGGLPQSTLVPDSFTHFETLNGQQGGTPATGTPSYSGVDAGARLTSVGFAWSSYAENIAIAYSSASNAFTINAAQVESFHKGWWESSGHRTNMLSSSNTNYGVHFDTRNITAQQAIDANFGSFPARSVTMGTEVYSRPASNPMRYIGGLFFRDLDSSGGWNPHNAGPSQEGLAGVSYQILNQSTNALVTSGVTSAVGSFSSPINSGTYKLVLTLANGTYTVNNIAMGTQNVILPDINRAVVASNAVLNVSQLPDPVLVVNGKAMVKPTSAGGAGVNKLTSLAIGAGGQLDLADNKLIVTSTPLGSWNGSAYTGITGLIQSGYASGAWNGSGIITSMPAAQMARATLGVATAAQAGRAGGTFGGVSVSGTDVLVMYTYAGDANLDGTINPDDYALISFNDSNPNARGYYNGDFNYDGDINADDFALIDFNFNAQGAPFPASSPIVSSVPEPHSFGLGIVLPLLMLRRGKHQRRTAW